MCSHSTWDVYDQRWRPCARGGASLARVLRYIPARVESELKRYLEPDGDDVAQERALSGYISEEHLATEWCHQHQPPAWALRNFETLETWIAAKLAPPALANLEREFALFQAAVKEKTGIVYVTFEERREEALRRLMREVTGVDHPGESS